MKNIGFIGIGVMGKSMVSNLLKNDYSVSIYTRTKEKALDVINEGAIWCESIANCVKNKDVVITIVGYPNDVEEVYFGENGIIANAKENSIIIDMTTTTPTLSVEIYEKAKKRNIFSLDAPVSGGDVGAKNGTLSIMVGGDRDKFDAVLPIFNAMGKDIVYQGKAGSGQHTKMANQIALSGAIAGVCEAITYARSAGLDVETMLSSINKGAAGSWQMDNMAPRMLKGNFDPGFFIKHYIKDMNIAVSQAFDFGVNLPISDEVLNMYKDLAENGMDDLGTQALIKYYEKQ